MRVQGTVKFFILMKGYGFIIADREKEEVFLHATNICGARKLEKGQRVSFKIAPGKDGKGPKAIDVQVADADR